MNRMSLIRQLIAHEGLKLKPYRCTAGKLTVGVGRNIEDNGIREDEALYMLRNDVNVCIADVIELFPNFETLSDARQHVLIDMRFNLGPGRFRQFKRMIDAVGNNDFKQAAYEMKNSCWYKQVGNRSRTLERMMQEDISFT